MKEPATTSTTVDWLRTEEDRVEQSLSVGPFGLHSLCRCQSHTKLASVRLKGGEGEVSLTVVAAYAPILDAGYGEMKGSIYDGFQDAVDRVLAGDIRIVSGDGNTRQVPWARRPRLG